MESNFDAIVVGCGILGASTAYHLRKAGASVLLLEKGTTPACGTTGASAAIVRQHYSNRILTRLTGESILLLKELEQSTGRASLFHPAGWYFLVTEGQINAARQIVEMQHSESINSSLQPIAEVRDRMPWLNPGGVGALAFEPDSGYADPVRSTEAFVHEYQRLGGKAQFGAACLGLLRSGQRVMGVQTRAARYHAGHVVNACGPWARELAATADIEVAITIYREQETIWQCRNVEAMPPSSISSAVDAIYLRPLGGGRYTVGRGFPKEYTAVDPSQYQRDVDDGFIKDVQQRLQRRFPPFANAQFLHGFASLYDVTPDWYPFLGLRRDVCGYADASGGSGHGFKLAPALGARLAKWILDGTVDPEVKRLSYDRVRENRLFEQKYGGNRG